MIPPCSVRLTTIFYHICVSREVVSEDMRVSILYQCGVRLNILKFLLFLDAYLLIGDAHSMVEFICLAPHSFPPFFNSELCSSYINKCEYIQRDLKQSKAYSLQNKEKKGSFT